MPSLVREGEIKAPRLVPGLNVRAGQVIAGKYRVEHLLGTGPTGAALAAWTVPLRVPVTLKIFASYNDEENGALPRRIENARRALGLRNVHVARVLDVGTIEDGLPFVATERFEGETLAAVLSTRTRLPVDEAVRWVLEACEGLADAHATGLVHGDLKPHNLFLSGENGRAEAGDGAAATDTVDPRVLKILDFGTAIGGPTAETHATWFESPAYLAPEQIRDANEVDARADIWALGVILHELISGTLPFQAESVSGVLVAVASDAAPLLAEAPYKLAKIVHGCLEKDPAARPASVAALARRLAPFTRGGPMLAKRVRDALARPAPVTEPTEANDAAPKTPAHGSHQGHRRVFWPRDTDATTKSHDTSATTEPSARVRASTRKRLASVVVVAAALTTAWLATHPDSAERLRSVRSADRTVPTTAPAPEPVIGEATLTGAAVTASPATDTTPRPRPASSAIPKNAPPIADAAVWVPPVRSPAPPASVRSRSTTPISPPRPVRNDLSSRHLFDERK